MIVQSMSKDEFGKNSAPVTVPEDSDTSEISNYYALQIINIGYASKSCHN